MSGASAPTPSIRRQNGSWPSCLARTSVLPPPEGAGPTFDAPTRRGLRHVRLRRLADQVEAVVARDVTPGHELRRVPGHRADVGAVARVELLQARGVERDLVAGDDAERHAGRVAEPR